MGVKYVKEFEHPEDFGFSGSAGKVVVKGYVRGGPVRKSCGGPVSKGGGGMAPKSVSGTKIGGKGVPAFKGKPLVGK